MVLMESLFVGPCPVIVDEARRPEGDNEADYAGISRGD